MKEDIIPNIDLSHEVEQTFRSALKKDGGSVCEIISPADVEALCRGDQEAFRKIYLHSYDKLTDFLTYLLHSKEDAEEAVQDIFLYILENTDRIDPGKNFKGYLYTIAKHAAYKQIRRRKHHEQYHDYRLNVSPGLAWAPDELVMTDELALLTTIYIDNMPPQRRRVYELSRIEGKSIREIAEIMDLSPQTVKNYLQTATNGLRELIALFVILFFR